MKIVSFITQRHVIRQILDHCGLWKEIVQPALAQATLPARPPPDLRQSPPLTDDLDPLPDYSVFDLPSQES